jgi:hypothetical protein
MYHRVPSLEAHGDTRWAKGPGGQKIKIKNPAWRTRSGGDNKKLFLEDFDHYRHYQGDRDQYDGHIDPGHRSFLEVLHNIIV